MKEATMFERRHFRIHLLSYMAASLLSIGWLFPAPQAISQAPPAAVNRQLGTVKSLAADTVTLTTDGGQPFVVQVAPDAKIVKLPAGSKDMKYAQPIALKDVAVGDRLLVRGEPGDAAGTLLARSIVVMKGDEIERKRQQEQQDWQKRGTGGLVKSVDPAANTITISAAGQGTAKTTTIHTSSATVTRRYAPDSVKFEDVQPGTLAQIQPGDQLRARGSRNAAGDLDAEEIVSGSFRNVAGTVSRIDPASGMLEIKDASTQKPVAMKISSDSQLRRLPPMAAQMMARRVSGAGASATTSSASSAALSGSSGHSADGPATGLQATGGTNAHSMGREAPDLQLMMAGLPKMPPEQLHSGDAVMIVATPGSANAQGTVITLLAGVEAILAATPKGAQVMTLSPWNVNGSPGDSAGTP